MAGLRLFQQDLIVLHLLALICSMLASFSGKRCLCSGQMAQRSSRQSSSQRQVQTKEFLFKLSISGSRWSGLDRRLPLEPGMGSTTKTLRMRVYEGCFLEDNRDVPPEEGAVGARPAEV